MCRMMRLFGVASFCALMCSGVASAADSIDDVEKKLIEAAEKNKSMTAKMTMTMEMDQPSMKMNMKGEGTMETARRGDKLLSRSEFKSSNTTKMGDQPEQKMEQKTLAVMDGDYVYSLTESNGQKSAMKMKIDPAQQKAVTKAMFDVLRKDNELKLLPDEKIDGKDTYVIQATPKKPVGTEQKTTFWFEKSCAVTVKLVSEVKMEQGKTTTTMTMSDIKLGVDIKPDRFVFKAPEGVEVQDMTKMGQAETTTEKKEEPAKTSTESTDKKAEEKKPEEKKPEEKKPEPQPEKKKSIIPKFKLK